jgi:5'-3' exonuclease
MSNTTLIIDGDVIAYGACRNRWGSVYDAVPPEFTLEEDVTYFSECVANLHNIINQLKEVTFAENTLIAIKGKNNFRNTVYPLYKQHRTKTVRPVQQFVDLLRAYMSDNNLAVEAHGMEADDLLRIWHAEEVLKGNTPVIASIDKDLLCITGLHYRFPKGNLYESGSRDANAIIEVDQWSADLHYHKQLLMGDSTDNIPGLPKIGPKRAEAILSDCKTVEDLQFMTCYAYKEIIGAEWRDALILTGKLITILPTRDYEFSIDNWKQPKE